VLSILATAKISSIVRRVSIPLLTLPLLLAPAVGLALSSTTLVTLTETRPNDRFGSSVSSAGDVNGDGIADVIVGAPLHDNVAPDAGSAYVYFGGTSPNAFPDLTLAGEDPSEAFGISVGSGDVNGDGSPDLIVGAVGYADGGAGAGQVFVYFGGPGLDDVVDWSIPGAPGEGLGARVSWAGDVNGDGYGDIIASTYIEGNAYVYYGGAAPNSVADLTLNNDSFQSVSGAGDVNGDGYADVIAGAASGTHAYVYFGGPGADAIPDLTFTGTGGFGASVSSADVNGDGYSDLIVGAPSDSGTGRTYVYYGGPGADAVADLTLSGAAAGDAFGSWVSGTGDLNGDGYRDVIVGAPYNDAGGADAGRAYVYFGGPGADAVADLIMTGATAGDHFGIAVSGAGDFNGDAHPDVIVGTDATPSTCHAYVLSLTLPSVSQSYYVPQSGSTGTPSEGWLAVKNFWTCPNNDNNSLPNNARIKLVIKDSSGIPISGIAASDINIRFNGGTRGPSPGQGYTGPDADSVIANQQYNPAAHCPDVRRIPADAASDANGLAFMYFHGPAGVRDPNRKWGHYDTEIPVYALGVKLQGRLMSGSSNGSYMLEIKNLDVAGGLTIIPNQGEVVNSLDRSPMQAHLGQPDSADPINWWLDFNSDGVVNSLDNAPQLAHSSPSHTCSYPNNP
jgi:hypothetical protein